MILSSKIRCDKWAQFNRSNFYINQDPDFMDPSVFRSSKKIETYLPRSRMRKPNLSNKMCDRIRGFRFVSRYETSEFVPTTTRRYVGQITMKIGDVKVKHLKIH